MPATASRFLLPVLLVLIGLATSAVVIADLKAISGPDLRIHYQWSVQFIAALREGALYPRWAALSNGGLGDPTFLFIHPLFYYAVAMVERITHDTWTALLWVPALASSLAAALAFFALRRHAGTWLAFAGGALVALSPYAFHLAHYQQFLPMHFALYAVVLYLWADALPVGWRRVVALALAVGLLVSSHILMAFMMLVVAAPVVVLRALRARSAPQRWWILAGDGLGVALGLGLAAVYLYPALTSQHLITPSGWYQPLHLDWRNAFLFQVFTLPTTGYRWFHLQWTVALVTLCIAVFNTWGVWRVRAHKSAVWWLAVDCVAATWIALLLGSELSYALWERSEIMRRLQFPIRLLGIASIISIFALVYVAAALQVQVQDRRRLAFASLAGALMASVLLHGVLEYRFLGEARPARSLTIAPDQFRGQPEMKPAGAGDGWRSYLQRGGLQGECQMLGMTCATDTNTSLAKSWILRSDKAQAVKLPLFSFPGWQLRIGEMPLASEQDADTGLFKIQLPQGSTTVNAAWIGIPAERVGKTISWVALILVILAALRMRQTGKAATPARNSK